MSFRYNEIVKIIETGPYEIMSPEGAPPLNFRIEILRRGQAQSYFARVYRLETLRVEPTFCKPDLNPVGDNRADHDIYVLDDFIGSQDFEGSSLDDVFEKVQSAFADMFNV